MGAGSHFDEHFTDNTAALAMAAAAFAVMCAGLVLLTQTAPAAMNAELPLTSNNPATAFVRDVP